MHAVLTKCSLAAIMASQPINPKTNQPYRPTHLPPPTTVPLRHCSHNADSTPIGETECLLSLFAPSSDSTSKKNKEHYILATAEPPSPEKAAASVKGDHKTRRRAETEAQEAVKRAKALRSHTRAIPGVPIVYVKRSVMVLEPLSTQSEGVRDGFEKGKFRAGLDDSSLGKRKRDGADGADGNAASAPAKDAGADAEKPKKKRKDKTTKGPNPLSVRKPKKREQPALASGDKKETRKETAVQDDGSEQKDGESSVSKPKRRRRHHKSENEPGAGAEAEAETRAEDTSAPEPAE